MHLRYQGILLAGPEIVTPVFHSDDVHTVYNTLVNAYLCYADHRTMALKCPSWNGHVILAVSKGP